MWCDGDVGEFRFMDLEIWRDAIEVGVRLFDLVDTIGVEEIVSICRAITRSDFPYPNNIAEGSGSSSKREFSNFFNIARRSTFENTNVVLVLEKRGLIDEGQVFELLERLDHLSPAR